MLWLGALSALVAGVALAIAAFPLRRVFAPKDAAPNDGPPNDALSPT